MSLVRAFLPLLAAVLAVAIVAVTRFTERSSIGTPMEDVFYGFFFRSYPLFLFAAAYGVARIVTAAITEPGPRRSLRAVTTPLAVALFLAAAFYPTFGGIILRPGFATGGIGFLNGLPASVAGVLGAAVAAFMFGLLLGIATLLATTRIRFSKAALAHGLLAFLALWVGAVILTLPDRLGLDMLDRFPLRALGIWQAFAAAGLVALAMLPHAMVMARRQRRMAGQLPAA
ncbi:MAG TPA: hypothetical protein VIL09_07060 [Microvirga sp.]